MQSETNFSFVNFLKGVWKSGILKLYEYLEHNNTLSPFQFGSPQGKCTVDAIFELVDPGSSAFEGLQLAVGQFWDPGWEIEIWSLGYSCLKYSATWNPL